MEILDKERKKIYMEILKKGEIIEMMKKRKEGEDTESESEEKQQEAREAKREREREEGIVARKSCMEKFAEKAAGGK